MKLHPLNLVALLASFAASSAVVIGQDLAAHRLGAARDLYTSAEYERALTVLEEIDSSRVTPDEARDRALHQALCFLALNRQPEAASRIEEVVQTMPLYRPDGDMPPRLRTLLDEVRGRMLPALVQRHYRSGREFFDAGKYGDALREFDLVLQLAEGAEHPTDASTLADVTTLASGFRDLSRARSAGSISLRGAVSKPDSNAGSVIVPPVTIRQNIPALPSELIRAAGQRPGPLSGEVDIVVSQSGGVQSVKIVESIHPLYDGLLLAAAKQWKYEPATRDGVPVEFAKRLEVNVTVK